MIATSYEHIVISEDGVPFISGTQTKVIELIVERVAYGWSAEELHLQHPYLTMGQIHSALAYYWDHTDALDEDIERRLAYVEDLRASNPPSQLRRKLKSKGLLG